MSTLNPTRKISRRHELREDTMVTLYARVLNLVERNRNVVLAAGAVVIIAVVAVVGYSLLMVQRNQTAVDQMAGAVQAWEASQYRIALDGAETHLGLLDIIDEFGGTTSGNLARYYAADAHFQLGEYDAAYDLFEQYEKEANLLGAAALAAEAAILETRGQADEAGDRYRRAATIFASDVTSPLYLMKAGRAYEAAGDRDAARRAYEQIQSDYAASQEARDIAFYLARVAGDV